MESRDFASDSDTDDEDFVPTGVVSDDGSGSDASLDNSADEASEDAPKGRKRKKGSSKSKKKKKLIETPVEEEKPTPSSQLNEEERKKRAESLWADFLSDVGPKLKSSERKESSKANDSVAKSTASEKKNDSCETKNMAIKELDNPSEENKLKETKPSGGRSIDQIFQEKENNAKKTDVEEFQFAGETVKIEKKVVQGRPVGGVAAILGQLKGKGKLSTLEKSKLDWESFKANEGITEDIRTHNKGKQGYLDKQDFLQRADIRQFEIEKGMRAATRRTNR